MHAIHIHCEAAVARYLAAQFYRFAQAHAGLCQLAIWFAVLMATSNAMADTYVGTKENPQAETAISGRTYSVGDFITFDDNLFRLPNETSPAESKGVAGATRSDSIDRATARFTGQWVTIRQILALDFSINNDRYFNNTYLNNVSGTAHLLWDWTLSKWTGQVGIDHERALANFANTSVFQRNVIDTSGYFTYIKLQVRPSWAITANVRQADTRQSLVENNAYSQRTTTGSFGGQWTTSASNTLGVEYSYTRAEYPYATASSDAFQPDFHDSTTSATFRYEPSDKTLFTANAGYLKRDYLDQRLPTYSGDVWHANLKWAPGAHTAVAASLSHDLQSYVENQTEYFVDNGRSVSATWTPREFFSFIGSLSWDEQTYIAAPIFAATTLGRRDTFKSQKINCVYNPRGWLSLSLGIGILERDTNYALYQFHDRTISLGLKITL